MNRSLFVTGSLNFFVADPDDNHGVAMMNTKDAKPVWEKLLEQLRTPLISDDELAQRIAILEKRVAVHDQALNFLMTVLEQLKEGGGVVLSESQRAQVNRWLDEFEGISGRPGPSQIN